MSEAQHIIDSFWKHHPEIEATDAVRAAVVAALEFSLDEGNDPTVDTRIENAVQAMVDTQPSWGWRLARVWSALGHDFGDAESFDWSLQRDFIRFFSHHPEAVKAIVERNDSYPPMGEVLR